MKVFVIGASGLVGSHCSSYFREKGWTVRGSHCNYRTDGTCYYNISQPMSAENFDVVAFKPEVIVHCAALTNVDYCETHEEESYQQTVHGTQHVCELAVRCGARLVYISTDYVFDGKTGPYREDDIPNPINVYGKHKLLAEQLVLATINDSLVIRITNVYGDDKQGKNFLVRIVQQCQQEDTPLFLRLPFDQFATPINARDIARAMFHLIDDKKTGIYHLASTDYMNRVELATRITSSFPNGQCKNIESVDSVTLKQRAKRPLFAGLLKLKFTSEYPAFVFTNVDDYLISITQVAISS